MANKDLAPNSHDVDVPPGAPMSWWYEEPAGLVLYDATGGSHYIGVIPWRDVRAALKRKDKK